MAKLQRMQNGDSMRNKRRSFADDGWAVWIDGDDVSTVYLNDWLSPRGHSFVDLAVRIRGIQATRSLSLFIPFSVSKEELRDISLLLQDEQILRATFSAGCIIDYLKNDCTSEVAYNGRTVDLVHISRFGFSLEPLADGTMLSVDLEALREYLVNDEAYFLFRLPHKSLDEVFCRKINVGGLLGRVRDLLTTPVLSEKYGYSVRINEARLLPPEINRIGAFHRQKLKKAVITLSINDAYEVSDRNCYRIRRLEENLYRSYVPEGFSCEDVITYQWNQTREYNLQGHFNFYLEIGRESISRTSMFAYMILLLMVGAGGNALWTLIQFLLGW